MPTTTRLLLNTRIGLPLLRPLLRSEIGEAAHRRAWHSQGKLTRDVLALYTAPLHCEGWDRALWEARLPPSPHWTAFAMANLLRTLCYVLPGE